MVTGMIPDIEDTMSGSESSPIAAALRALSIDQFCHRYGIGRTTAYAEIAAGRLRCRKVGKRSLIAEDDAEAWLEGLRSISPFPTAK
jgi:excisionase family DNA binding protein